MENLETTPELKHEFIELPFTTVGIINANFEEFTKLVKNAEFALAQLNGFKLKVQYGGTKES